MSKKKKKKPKDAIPSVADRPIGKFIAPLRMGLDNFNPGNFPKSTYPG